MQSLGKKYKRITGVDALVGNKCLGSHGGWTMLTSWKVGLKKGYSSDVSFWGEESRLFAYHSFQTQPTFSISRV